MSHCCRCRGDFLPGDQLYFLGEDETSRAIAWKTASWGQRLVGPKFSHVAICGEIHHGQLVFNTHCGVLLFESTTLCDLRCTLTGKSVKGVQAHDPQTRIDAYRGQVWRLRLTDPLAAEESRKLTTFLLSEIGKPYDYRRALRLAGRHFDAESMMPTPNARFCSELNAIGLKRVDRIGRDHDPESFSPNSLARLMLHSGEVFPIGQGGSEQLK